MNIIIINIMDGLCDIGPIIKCKDTWYTINFMLFFYFQFFRKTAQYNLVTGSALSTKIHL